MPAPEPDYTEVTSERRQGALVERLAKPRAKQRGVASSYSWLDLPARAAICFFPIIVFLSDHCGSCVAMCCQNGNSVGPSIDALLPYAALAPTEKDPCANAIPRARHMPGGREADSPTGCDLTRLPGVPRTQPAPKRPWRRDTTSQAESPPMMNCLYGSAERTLACMRERHIFLVSGWPT